jgi:hypothetical protein
MNDVVPAQDALSAAAGAIHRATTIAGFNPRPRGANTDARRNAYPRSTDTRSADTGRDAWPGSTNARRDTWPGSADADTGPDTYTGGANTGGRSRSLGWACNTTFRHAGAGAIDSRARLRCGKCEAQYCE